MRIRAITAASVALILAGCGGGGSVATKTVTVTAPPATVTVPAPPSAPSTATVASPEPSATIPGDGTFRVGADVQPGTYTASPSRSGFNCWWYRLSDLSGSQSAVIDGGYGEGPQYVTIQPSDVAFKSEQCTAWQKVS